MGHIREFAFFFHIRLQLKVHVRLQLKEVYRISDISLPTGSVEKVRKSSWHTSGLGEAVPFINDSTTVNSAASISTTEATSILIGLDPDVSGLHIESRVPQRMESKLLRSSL